MDSLPEDKDYKDFLNPKSLETVIAHVEPDLFADKSIVPVQFERLGYFIKDSDSTGDKFVYNRTVGLKSNFSA